MKRDKTIACYGAKRYKGMHPPKCNGGDPCLTCRLKYAAATEKQT